MGPTHGNHRLSWAVQVVMGEFRGTKKVIAACLATGVLAGCGSSTARSPALRSVMPGGSPAKDGGRAAEIYAAVVRQLVLKDHGYEPAPSPYKAVFIVAAAIPRAGSPFRWKAQLVKGGVPFDDELQDAIEARVSNLPHVRFVDRPRQVVVGHPWRSVRHNGVLITLGPIRRGKAGIVVVPNCRWEGNLNGQWLSYLVANKSGQWRVTGVFRNHVVIS